MRLKFFERSENKFVSRIDPRERSERDHKRKFPGAQPVSLICFSNWVFKI